MPKCGRTTKLSAQDPEPTHLISQVWSKKTDPRYVLDLHAQVTQHALCTCKSQPHCFVTVKIDRQIHYSIFTGVCVCVPFSKQQKFKIKLFVLLMICYVANAPIGKSRVAVYFLRFYFIIIAVSHAHICALCAHLQHTLRLHMFLSFFFFLLKSQMCSAIVNC